MSDGCTCDFPGIHVQNVISKRFRALNRKLNYINQLEVAQSQGYFLNLGQLATVDSKSYVIGAIEELQKIVQPLTDAVSKDIEVAVTELDIDVEIEKYSVIEDMLKIMYVGGMFCCPGEPNAEAMMLARGRYQPHHHGRNVGSPDSITEMDFHLITEFAKMISGRSNSSLSHQEALADCVDRATRWVDGSDDDVEFYPGVTYAGLRQKLEKIIASDYFTTPPKMRAPGDVAAYGAYQVPPVHEHVASVNLADQEHHGHREEERVVDVVGNGNNDQSGGVVVAHNEGVEGESYPPVHVQSEEEVVVQEEEVREYVPRGAYQNQRGGGRGMNGGGGRRGGYPGGGGRGSFRGEGYLDGRNHYYDQVGGSSYPRDNYYRGRGGRGRGTSSGSGSRSYSNHYEGGVGGQGGGYRVGN